MTPDRLTFFLGGRDLEMVTIRDLLAERAPGRWHDQGLAWGAKASAYDAEIEAARANGLVPVMVELEDDLGLTVGGDAGSFIVVDHHGPRAGRDRPTSLHQVFALLEVEPAHWSRWFDLVAANDLGHIPAMTARGATPEEIRRVRAADRAAQGITAEQEAQAEQAAAAPQHLAGGLLTVVALPHDRTAAVADRLAPELGGPGCENLLILGPTSVHFFGAGELVLALDRTLPGGWYGGALPDRGFWGHAVPVPDALAYLIGLLDLRANSR